MDIPLVALALRLRSLLALLLIGALALPDGVRATPVAQQVDVDIDAAHLAFPATLPAGLLRITAQNSSPVSASAGFARLAPGVTAQQATVALEQAGNDPSRLAGILTFVGGITDLPPHAKTATTVTILPGTYQMLGGGDTPQILYFSVVAASGATAETLPVSATVRLGDSGLSGLPRHLPPGAVTLRLINAGRSPHRLLLIGLRPGRTVRDVQTLLLSRTSDPAITPWVREVFGVDLLSPGQAVWPNPTLTPGTYVAVYPIHGSQPGRVLGTLSVP